MANNGSLKRIFSPFLKNQKGQSLIEFALFLPILFLLVAGIIQFGVVLYGQIAVTSAAREGARLLSIASEDSTYVAIAGDVAALTEDIFFLNVNPDEIKFDPEVEPWGDGINAEGVELSIIVPATVDIVMPVLNYFIGDYFNIFGKASMRYQIAF